MSKIIVFGGIGQLGSCINKMVTKKGLVEYVFLNIEQGNISDLVQLEELFKAHQPSYVINCAAYTAVDQAEDELALSREINKTGASNLAQKCVEHNAILIHISTDFVFEGNLPKLLNEEDAENPINVYGRTKLEGEQAIQKVCEHYFIVRTSWLYSEYGGNFVKTMLRLGQERESLNIISDQIGTPTYAMDLASVLVEIVESGNMNFGIYHYSNEGVASWYDFAKAIFELGKVNTLALPIPTAAYPTKAQRPQFSVLDKSKMKKTFNLEIPYWRESLQKCIHQLTINQEP